jgi:hypothetical protein
MRPVVVLRLPCGARALLLAVAVSWAGSVLCMGLDIPRLQTPAEMQVPFDCT